MSWWDQFATVAGLTAAACIGAIAYGGIGAYVVPAVVGGASLVFWLLSKWINDQDDDDENDDDGDLVPV